MTRRPPLARLASLAFGACFAVTLVACDGDVPEAVPLTVNFSQMNPHVGQLLELRIVDVDTGAEVDCVRIGSVPSPSFSIQSTALRQDHTYFVDWYADLSGNGQYDAPPTDHAWRRIVGPVDGPHVLNFVHDLIWVDIAFPPTSCSP